MKNDIESKNYFILFLAGFGLKKLIDINVQWRIFNIVLKKGFENFKFGRISGQAKKDVINFFIFFAH